MPSRNTGVVTLGESTQLLSDEVIDTRLQPVVAAPPLERVSDSRTAFVAVEIDVGEQPACW